MHTRTVLKVNPCSSMPARPALQQVFADEGLSYSMGGRTGNTLNSHRLLTWAAHEHGLQKQNALVVSTLFQG